MPGDPRDRVGGYQYDRCSLTLSSLRTGPTGMRFFSTQPTPAGAPPDPVRPTERATVADIMLAYRLILKREADPTGLAAYTQRVREGLTLEELLQCLLDSPEREDRIRTGDVQQGAARVPAADVSLIDPKQVMRRYSVAELNETADEYYRVMQDPDLTLRKPFQSVNETPEMLENLGALLGGLHLGKAMTVLDFGAGTCWLSRLVAKLNCAVICCDPSTAALDIGRRFFEEHPPLARELLPPRFLQFDGHALELADESVDRIICFDVPFITCRTRRKCCASSDACCGPGESLDSASPGATIRAHHSRSTTCGITACSRTTST